MLKIGIIKEGKIPQDTRVPLTPKQCYAIERDYKNITVHVQSSDVRCFSDAEYEEFGVKVMEDVSHCDVLFGVKEVPIDQLIPDKTYFFFSHTIKEQPYNREMLQEIIQQNIRLIDYECLKDVNGQRIIAFGHWAGIVGAHNGLKAFGHRTGKFELPPVHRLRNYSELKSVYNHFTLPPMKIVVTGGGRVSSGVIEVLEYLNIKRLSPELFLDEEFEYPVYTQLLSSQMYQRPDGGFNLKEFYNHPGRYESIFKPYTRVADIMINAIYWDPEAPVFFTKEDMRDSHFKIKTIADITCDIDGSVPATVRSSTIDNPVYGYDPYSGKEAAPFQEDVIDVMAVDNLPNELPRDASEDFGSMLIGHVLPELLKKDSKMLDEATIARNGDLTESYEYLRNYIEGK